MRGIVWLLMAAMLLWQVPLVWALQPDYSKNSFDAIVAKVQNVQTSAPVAAKYPYARIENKRLSRSKTQMVQPKPHLLPSPIPQFTMDATEIRPLPVSKSQQKSTLEFRPKPSEDKTVAHKDNLIVTPQILERTGSLWAPKHLNHPVRPLVKARALLCVDCSSNKVRLAQNSSSPLPIASITKLLTAMVVIDGMDLDAVLEVPKDIKAVERHVVGIKPGDLLSVRDLLHGLLIESGNDCAEVLARAYPKGGRDGFVADINIRAREIGATNTTLYTPSGLDMKVTGAETKVSESCSKMPNTASAEDVALIARHAFTYPLITKISSMKTYTMHSRNSRVRAYRLVSNDRLLHKGLPIAGAKTGYTDAAGKCIVALFKDQKKEHLVVVLNTPKHFNAAEKIYRWASSNF